MFSCACRSFSPPDALSIPLSHIAATPQTYLPRRTQLFYYPAWPCSSLYRPFSVPRPMQAGWKAGAIEMGAREVRGEYAVIV